MIPDWIKNNASWWSTNLINDIDFINGLQYLIEHKIIKIDNKKILGKVPLEDIRFSPRWQIDKDDLVFIQSSFFEAYGVYGYCITEDGQKVWGSVMIGLNPNKLGMYN